MSMFFNKTDKHIISLALRHKTAASCKLYVGVATEADAAANT